MTTTTTRVWHAATQRFGHIVCATSSHADGSPRVIVEWDDGTEGKVCEAELCRPETTASLLRELVDWAREHTSPRDPNTPHDILVRAVNHLAMIE